MEKNPDSGYVRVNYDHGKIIRVTYDHEQNYGYGTCHL